MANNCKDYDNKSQNAQNSQNSQNSQNKSSLNQSR